MSVVKEAVGTEVRLTGAVEGEYVIREQRSDGELVIVPKRVIADDERGRALTPEEWDAFLAEHGDDMLPADGEG
jgi:hypothetical protein